MDRTDIINHLVDKVGYKKNYLEIGLNDPRENYFKINCAKKESVDPFDMKDSHNSWAVDIDYTNYVIEKVLTYRMTSDDFFSKNEETYDVIFIDGLHEANQVRRDIINAVNSLNVGGFVVVHDCLPKSEGAQNDIWYPEVLEWNGTTWKAIPGLSNANGIKYHTVDTDFGCCIIEKVSYDVDFSEYQVSSLTYNDVFTNENLRKEIMHVISEDSFLKMYN